MPTMQGRDPQFSGPTLDKSATDYNMRGSPVMLHPEDRIVALGARAELRRLWLNQFLPQWLDGLTAHEKNRLLIGEDKGAPF